MSYMRKGPYDVRPSLLLLLLGQDMREVPKCLEYGRNYLRAWCCRTGFKAKEEALAIVAVDALAMTYRLRTQEVACKRRTRPLAVSATKCRAKELGTRDADFSKARKVAFSAYQTRFAEAAIAFQSAGEGAWLGGQAGVA